MINRLRIRFVLLAMTALFTLLAVIVSGMNLVNYRTIVNEADGILDILTENKGVFPEDFGGRSRPMPPNFSPETPYETRYFSVLLDNSGQFASAEIAKIASVNAHTAALYADKALENGRTRGFIDAYRYVYYSENTGSRILFLDWGRKMASFRDFLCSSIAMSLIGLAAVFPVLYSASGKILRPVAESYEKQRVFITDAGHEIKTPVTIISANAELLEMELGENESLRDILTQTQRLKSLTNDLILLSRMEETDMRLAKIDFPLSEAVAETAAAFRAPAAKQNKTLCLHIEPLLTLKGDLASVRKLVSLMIDNAVKYSPENSEISLRLQLQKNVLALTVSNPTQTPVTGEQLSHIFDRFYRTDASRNSKTGGHGIGLSVAAAIVRAHGGRLQAKTGEGGEFIITALFPASQ